MERRSRLRQLSPTPYGLGIVDIALITALARAGLKAPDAVGAVLLYRIVSFKILATLLWFGYGYLRKRVRPATACIRWWHARGQRPIRRNP
jgi:uncharacterized membrane protein YbhN (UPF0104 family)